MKMDITSLFVKTGPVYYGNAEPEGNTVHVGGHEIVVGGWGAHEATRREAHWRANPRAATAEPRNRYSNRTYISGQDTVESLLNRGGGPLERAAVRLAANLERFNAVTAQNGTDLWRDFGAVVASTITPEEIRAAADADPAQLHRLAETVGVFASGYAQKKELAALVPPRPRPLPPLPMRSVPLQGKNTAEINSAVAELERAAVPRVAEIERFRAAVAVVFDAAATVFARVKPTAEIIN